MIRRRCNSATDGDGARSVDHWNKSVLRNACQFINWADSRSQEIDSLII